MKVNKILIGKDCHVTKGQTGIQSVIQGEYPLVVTAEKEQTSNRYQFNSRNGGVCVPLVSSTGHGDASINRLHFKKDKFDLGSILAFIEPKDEKKINSEFLYYFLSNFKDEILVPLMKGGANVSLTLPKLKQLELNIPDISEQIKIINLVNKIKKCEKILNKKKELIEELPINIYWFKNSSLESKKKLQIIDDLFFVEKGSTQSTKAIPGKYTFITASKTYKTHNSFSHDASAVIYAVQSSGSLGRAHFYSGKFTASGLTLVITNKKNISNDLNVKFLKYFLDANKKKIIKQNSRGSSKITISKNNVKAIELPNYSDDEKKKIIEIMPIIQNLLNKNNEQLREMANLFKSIFREYKKLIIQ